MKIQTLALAGIVSIGVVAASTANAQSWHGFYVDGALGVRGSSSETKLNWTSIPPGAFAGSHTDNWGKTNFLGEFSGGWRWAPPGSSVVVGIGAFIDVADKDAGGSSSSDTLPTPFSDKSTIEQKDRYGLSVDIGPNWRTHPYAKLAYSWSKWDWKLEESGCAAVSGGNTHTGAGFGGGVRHLQSNNLYFFAEAMWQDYGSKDIAFTQSCGGTPAARASGSIKPKNAIGVIGLGWKF